MATPRRALGRLASRASAASSSRRRARAMRARAPLHGLGFIEDLRVLRPPHRVSSARAREETLLSLLRAADADCRAVVVASRGIERPRSPETLGSRRRRRRPSAMPRVARTRRGSRASTRERRATTPARALGAGARWDKSSRVFGFRSCPRAGGEWDRSGGIDRVRSIASIVVCRSDNKKIVVRVQLQRTKVLSYESTKVRKYFKVQRTTYALDRMSIH